MLGRTFLAKEAEAALIELPPYRLPNLRSVLIKLMNRGRVFLTRAGTIIFTVAVMIWALAYFPRPQTIVEDFSMQRTTAETTLTGAILTARLKALDPMQEHENDMLDFAASERKSGSRLSCQIAITDEMDGLVVRLPESQ